MKKESHRGVRSPPFVLPQFARAHAHLGAGWVWVDKAPDAGSTCPTRAISGDPAPRLLRPSHREGQRTGLSVSESTRNAL